MINLETIEDRRLSASRASEDKFTSPIQASHTQAQIWFADQFSESTYQHHWTILQINGPLHIESLKRAYNEVINKHDILKSAFEIHENELYQKVFQREEWSFDALDFSQASYSEIRHFMVREARRSFKLDKQPAIRAMLVKGGEDCFYFSIGIHPIAADKASISVFWHEVTHSYQVIESGSFLETRDKGLQFLEVANQQIADLEIGKEDQALEAWKRELSTFEQATITPDHKIDSEQNASYSILNFRLSDEVRKPIENQCEELEIEGHLYFLTAYKILLQQYTGRTDLMVACSFDGRCEDHKSMIGPFENVFPILSSIDTNRSFLDLVGDTGEALKQGTKYPHYPVHEIKIQSKFGYEEFTELSTKECSGIKFEWEVSPLENGPYELAFTINKDSEDLKAFVTFRTDLFKQGTIANLVQSFEEILKFITLDPNRPVSELSLTGHDEGEDSEVNFSGPTNFQNEIELNRI